MESGDIIVGEIEEHRDPIERRTQFLDRRAIVVGGARPPAGVGAECARPAPQVGGIRTGVVEEPTCVRERDRGGDAGV